ncbi:MAG: ChbG/HpnK family deacetylase [Verrucomicrobia bacterium]|nr:ChbG/HpnK family deacetylase [Verrucomicrobiota bacterium]
MKYFSQLLFSSIVLLSACFSTQPNSLLAADTGGEIQLLMRSDDMGVSQSINEACIQSYRDGVARSIEVIVTGAWFLDAARLLKENPGCDVGVHLCLTSEWDYCKWGPLTHAPTLVDSDGYFWPITRTRSSQPGSTGFLEANPDLAEVEAELRAQIEMALKHLPNVTHVSAHMGAATASPELRTLTSRIASEYRLRLESQELQRFPRIGGIHSQDFESELVAALGKLGAGTWMLVEHPGFDTPELRGFGHVGYENVAQHRAGVTKAFTSKKVKTTIQERGIQLISYADLKN